MKSLFGMMGMVMLATMFNFAEEGKGGQEKIEDRKRGITELRNLNVLGIVT